MRILKQNQEWHFLPGCLPPMFVEHESVSHRGGPRGDRVRSQMSSLLSLSFSLLSEKRNKKTDRVTPGWGQCQGPLGKPHRRTRPEGWGREGWRPAVPGALGKSTVSRRSSMFQVSGTGKSSTGPGTEEASVAGTRG